MQIDIDNLNPGTFFEWNDNSEGGITLKLCTGEDLKRIRRETEKNQPAIFRRGQRYELDPKVDAEKREQMIWDHSIVNWEGLKDANGNDVVCNLENKIKLMNGSIQFASFVGECLDILTNDMLDKQEEIEKN